MKIPIGNLHAQWTMKIPIGNPQVQWTMKIPIRSLQDQLVLESELQSARLDDDKTRTLLMLNVNPNINKNFVSRIVMLLPPS